MKNDNVKMLGIDIGKFVCAILVMISHLGPFESFGHHVNYYAVNLSFRYAVPFFFICSGYFLCRNIVRKGYLVDYLKRVMSLYCLWTIIYILFSLPFTISTTTIVEFLFRGIVFHLWFFPSLIVSVAFVFVFLNKINSKSAWFVVCLLYLIGLFGDSYGNLLPFFPIMKMFINCNNYLFGVTRNGILFASIFIYTGVFLAKNEDRFSRWSSKYKLIALIVSYSIWVVEFVFVSKMNLAWDLNLSIFIVPTAVCFYC